MISSSVNLQKILNDSDCNRIDADFFRKDYLEIEGFLKKKFKKKIEDFDISILHPGEFERIFTSEKKHLFLRAQNVRPFFCDFSNKVYISEKITKTIESNKLFNEDVLITRTGANFGQSCLFDKKSDDNVYASSHSLILRPSSINPYFLTIYLNTKFGKDLIKKSMYGAVQPQISPYYIYKFPYPQISEKFENLIEKKYKSALKSYQEAIKIIEDTNNFFLKKLNLNSNNDLKLTFTKNFRDLEDRIDPGFYQPAYEKLILQLKDKKHSTIHNLLTKKPLKGIEVGGDNYLNYNEKKSENFYRISDFNIFGFSNDCKKINQKISMEHKKHKINQGDVLFSKDGTLGISYHIDEEIKGILSGAFLMLSVKKNISKEYLSFVLNSQVIKDQILKISGGAIINHIKPDEVLSLIVPLIEDVDVKKIDLQMKNIKKLYRNAYNIASECVLELEEKINK
jgi:restriction endonuclease S subunit